MTSPAQRLGIQAAGAAVGLGLVVWLSGEIGDLLAHGRWPAVSPVAMVTVIPRLPGDLGHPASAWPAPLRTQLPAGWPWFAAGATIALAVAAAVASGAVVAFARARRMLTRWPWPGRTARENRPKSPPRTGPTSSPRTGPTSRSEDRPKYPPRTRRRSATHAWPDRPAGGHQVRPAGGAHWARPPDLRPLVVRRAGHGRLVLGRVGRSLIATEGGHSVLVMGPTQSGKTTGLAIPALLEWDGPVVATSVKDDLVGRTGHHRASLGTVWVFDPTGAGRAGRARSGWSPLSEATSWSGAQRIAQALVGAAPAQRGLGDSAFWFQTSAKLLAPLLLAAARGGRPMAEVVRWTNLQETDEPRFLLDLAGDIEAVHALLAGLGRDERIRSSVYTTLETVLAPYEDPLVAASAECSDISPSRLLEGANSLYLCGPTDEQDRVQGVFSALVGAVVYAAFRRYERCGPLDPPLLIVLDEAANIAPLQDLDKLASTGSGMGIQLVTVCQDLAQLTARYGAERARSIANNHRAKLALSGLGDVGTLDTMSALAGEQALREYTVTRDGGGRRSTSSAVTYRRLVAADEVRRVPPGAGILVYGHLAPARLTLRPWYLDRELSRRAAVGPQVDPDGRLTPGAADLACAAAGNAPQGEVDSPPGASRRCAPSTGSA